MLFLGLDVLVDFFSGLSTTARAYVSCLDSVARSRFPPGYGGLSPWDRPCRASRTNPSACGSLRPVDSRGESLPRVGNFHSVAGRRGPSLSDALLWLESALSRRPSLLAYFGLADVQVNRISYAAS